MPELGVLYSCYVCNKAFDSGNALRGHVSVHKRKSHKTSIAADAVEWARFVAICVKHHTTTCHVLNTILRVVNDGAEQGLINLATPNPIVVNISQNFMGKPKSPYKALISETVTQGQGISPVPPLPHHDNPKCLGCHIPDKDCTLGVLWRDKGRCLRLLRGERITGNS